MRKFDLVHCVYSDAEIKELQALCANTVSDILTDINDYDTLKAAKRWIKQVIDEVYAMRVQRDRDKGYTLSTETKFYYNRAKYDKRFDFQSDFYVTVARIVGQRLLDFDHRWSDNTILILANAISDGLNGWYEAGRKIPKNQWWEEDFEVDRVLWRLMTAMKNMLVQRDTPNPAGRWVVNKYLVTNSITSYLRCILNAFALCSLIEVLHGPNPTSLLETGDPDDVEIFNSWLNLSRLVPGIIETLLEVQDFNLGGAQ